MEIKHTTIPQPMVTEHTLFEDRNIFAKNVLEQKKIIIEVRFNTKTSVYINVRLEQFCAGVNHKITDLKYHSPKPEWSYFSGVQEEKHFLKLLKNQGFEAIKQHCEAVVNQFFPVFNSELEELTLEYFETDALKAAIAKDSINHKPK
jgi:hypothetical protein